MPEADIVLEAEDQEWAQMSHLFPGFPTTERRFSNFTGRGFGVASSSSATNGVLNLEFSIPFQVRPAIAHEYCIWLRYISGDIQLADGDAGCSTTSKRIGIFRLTSCPRNNCSRNLQYIVTLDFRLGLPDILHIDSLVLKPRLDEVTGRLSPVNRSGNSMTSPCLVDSVCDPPVSRVFVSAELYGGAKRKMCSIFVNCLSACTPLTSMQSHRIHRSFVGVAYSVPVK